MVFGAVQAGYLFSPQMLEKLSQLRNSGLFYCLKSYFGTSSSIFNDKHPKPLMNLVGQ